MVGTRAADNLQEKKVVAERRDTEQRQPRQAHVGGEGAEGQKKRRRGLTETDEGQGRTRFWGSTGTFAEQSVRFADSGSNVWMLCFCFFHHYHHYQ